MRRLFWLLTPIALLVIGVVMVYYGLKFDFDLMAWVGLALALPGLIWIGVMIIYASADAGL